MERFILETAADVMHVTVEEAEQHCKAIPEHNAFYFWDPTRGGIAVIIDENGEKLGATSSVSFDRHLEAFLDGRRN